MSGSEEDTARLIAQLFPCGYKGVYVDVGAGYPEYYSNSYPFRRKGWQVIAIEPQPQMCDEFRRRGFEVLQYACASTDIGETDFEVLDFMHGLGGSSFKILDDHPQSKVSVIRVQALTLNTILGRHHPSLAHFDVLDIDVEYYELDVLLGVDLDRYGPCVLVVENLPTESGVWLNPNRERLYDYYREIGYRVIGRAAHNEILVRTDDARFHEWVL